MTTLPEAVVERIDRRLLALEQMYPGTNRVFADRDGQWSLPQLRAEIAAALNASGIGELVEALTNMVALAEPHFTDAPQTLALNAAINALARFTNHGGEGE